MIIIFFVLYSFSLQRWIN